MASTGAVRTSSVPKRPSSSAEVLRCFEEGRYDEAAVLYDENERYFRSDPKVAFIRARIFMRKAGQAPKALALLNKIEKPIQPRDAVWRDMLLGEAYCVTGDCEAADVRLSRALQTAKLIGEPALLAEVGYRLGRRHVVSCDEPEKARPYLRLVRNGGSLESRLNALHLESWILSRESRPREQGRILIELLSTLDRNSALYTEHRIRATQTLAALARETFFPEALPLVEHHLGGLPWPPDFKVALFQTTKGLAWAKALQGDYFNGFRLLKRSANIAPNTGWQTVALCDRAYLALARGQELWFRQELSDAEEAAQAVDWENVDDEACIGMLLMAELLAPVDGARASEYLARFRALSQIKNPTSLLKRDRRFDAMVEFSSGTVDLALGDAKLGVSRLKSAMGTYERAGFHWRAARAALRLYDATRRPLYLDSADKWLEHYRFSWLQEELRYRRCPATASPELSPMRQKVFELLCKGKSNSEIAALLGLSVATIANHAKAVLKAFEVSSRHALIAKAVELRMVSPPQI